MKIQIKTFSEQVSAYVTINLFMDDDGMKYAVHDARCPQKTEEIPLSLDVPMACRREIRRRMIPNVDGKSGVLPQYQEVSPLTDNFIFECIEEILRREPQLEEW